MHPATYKAFLDEVEKIAHKEKVAIDPMTLAGIGAAGKIMTTNALHRFGHHLPPLRRLAQEVAGVGARTAMQGKPMLSAPLRHAMAVGMDPKLVGLYETAHRAGGAAKGVGGLQQLGQHLSAAKQIPELAHAAEFAKGIPLESKGLRKVVDYGFTPVSQVGKDLKGVAGRAAQGVGNAAKSVGKSVGSALSKANPMKLLKKTPA